MIQVKNKQVGIHQNTW